LEEPLGYINIIHINKEKKKKLHEQKKTKKKDLRYEKAPTNKRKTFTENMTT